jgi:hypothetical protein
MTQRGVIFIFGQDGTGKTTMADELARSYSRVLILDADFRQFKATHVAGFDEAVSQLGAWKAFGSRAPFRLSFTPLPDEYDHCFLLARDLGNCVIIGEEFDRFSGMGRWESEYVYRGRHWGVDIIGLTIQPMAVPKDFRRIVKEIRSFRQIEPSDIDYTASIVGDMAYEIPSLRGPGDGRPPFDYLRWTPHEGAKIHRFGRAVARPAPASARHQQEAPPPCEVEGAQPTSGDNLSGEPLPPGGVTP